MLTLAIETSCETAGVALVSDGDLLALRQRRHRMDTLARLTAEIDEMLRCESLRVGDLDGIAVSLGPGSFTGLRIGIATAKALAFAAGKPIVGVPTLDVLAKAAADLCPEETVVVPAIQARPGEVYLAFYHVRAGRIERFSDYAAIALEEVASATPAGLSGIRVCGPGAVAVLEGFRAIGIEAILLGGTLSFPDPRVLGGMGEDRLSRGEADDVVGLVPLYVRRPTPEIRLEGAASKRKTED